MAEILNEIEIEDLLKMNNVMDGKKLIDNFFGIPDYFTLLYMKQLKYILKKYFKETASDGYGSFNSILKKIQYDFILTKDFLIRNIEGINYTYYYMNLHSLARNKKYFNDMKERKDIAFYHNGLHLMEKAKKSDYYNYYSLNETVDGIELDINADKHIMKLNSIFITFYISYFYFNKIIIEHKNSLFFDDSKKRIIELKRLYKRKIFGINI
jgi:hypothetical protein